MIVIAYDDRPRAVVGLKLLVLSLQRHCPGLRLRIGGTEDPDFTEWARRYPEVEVAAAGPRKGAGYNVKPGFLMDLLDEGHDEVVWIDSDIIATGDVRKRLAGLSRETIAITQDTAWCAQDAGFIRTRGWDLEPGREMPFVVNSGVVRVTPCHRELLLAWEELLSSERYLAAQRAPYDQRPIGMLGDQDVLEGLLGSKRFSNIPVEYLRRGTDIIQYFGATGYTLSERLEHVVRAGPVLVHSMGTKLWDYPPGAPSIRQAGAYYERVWQDVSPYSSVAAGFKDELGEATPWMEPRTLLGRLMRMGSFGVPVLAGLPQAAADGLLRGTKRTLTRLVRSVLPGSRSASSPD